MSSSYVNNFPFPTLRTNQENVLKQIEEAFNSGHEYVLVYAPTGTGKSPIAVASALAEGSSYILTSAKNL